MIVVIGHVENGHSHPLAEVHPGERLFSAHVSANCSLCRKPSNGHRYCDACLDRVEGVGDES
ncbi:MAG TPA: hypothetical protein VHV75_09900 [Solirubrobacteraceae bacterium]|jgi:hypothetical protein|nr:hypothetical protein [Solirubrobacteraceae bacterium]